jgi:hypothetical protein
MQLAIVHDLRSLILVEIHDKDLQTGGGLPINLCYRLQCCQIEEIEFKMVWLGDPPDDAGKTMTEDGQFGRRDRERRRITY